MITQVEIHNDITGAKLTNGSYNLIATEICTLRKVAATCIAINEKNTVLKSSTVA